jgi:hypothetical protein
MTAFRIHRWRIASLVASIPLLLAVPTAVRGDVDASNTCLAATPIAVSSAWTNDTIGSTTDVDWFRFTVPGSRYVMITLGNLMVDARLDLYAGCGKHVAGSNRPGNQYEEIYRKLTPGTYRIRVSGVGGAYSMAPYSVRVRPLGSGVVVLSSSGWNEFANTPRIAGEVINDSVSAREDVEIWIRFYDKANTLIGTPMRTWARRERFWPGQRSMFLWDNETIAGFDHYTVAVGNAPVAGVAPYAGLVVHPGAQTLDGFGGMYFNGTLQNTTGHAVGVPRVMLTIYDALGQVRNAGFTDTEPGPMAAHSTNPYEIHLNDRTTGNRVVFTAHGYQN